MKNIYKLAFGWAVIAFPLHAEGLFTVGGKSYSEKDLTPGQQQQVFEIELQRFEQTKVAVDNFLFDMQISEEMKKQGKSKEEVEAKILDVKEPNDKAVKAWFEANKTKIPPQYKFDDIKGQIVQVVKQEEMKKKRDAYLDKLKKDKKFALNIAKPESPLVDVKFDGFPTKGKEGAKVTVVEFADFQCPHCKVASESFKKVTEKFKDKIKFVYLDFPINPSGISRVVAEGSHCAEEQGKYWDYHYKAFEGQATLDKESPTKLAKELKLDEAKFKTCIEGTKAKAIVEKGRAEGDRIGVSGTPYLLINGRRYMGAHTVEAISKEIETSLK